MKIGIDNITIKIAQVIVFDFYVINLYVTTEIVTKYI